MGGYRIRGNKIHVFGTVNGRNYRFSTGKDATELNKKWISKNHENVLLQLIDKQKQPKSLSLVEYGYESLKNNEYQRKANTTTGFKCLFEKYIVPYFKSYDITDIKAGDIKRFQSYLFSKDLSPQSVKNIRTVLGTIIKDAMMDEIINTNPLKLVKAPKVEINIKDEPFTLEEVKLILKNADEWIRQYLTVALFVGARTGEILALKWEDIDFENNKIYIQRSMTKGTISSTKTGKSRLIDMLPIVAQSLKEFYKNKSNFEYIFVNSFGNPYTDPKPVSKLWKATLKKCNLKYRKVYNTRHTFATTMLLGGEDILWVSQMLGHSDVSTTTRYYIKYIKSNNIKRAIFLDNFDTNMTQSINEMGCKAHKKAI